jgi:flagellar basal-body rod protein FlgB
MAGLQLFNFTQQLLELSMRVRGARHEILSANIANADTPGYRARDLDFKSVMDVALNLENVPAADHEPRLETLSSSSLDLRSALYVPEYPETGHGEDRLDGNSVSLDRQMVLLTENALAYEAALTLLSRKLAGLRYVISEGKR